MRPIGFISIFHHSKRSLECWLGYLDFFDKIRKSCEVSSKDISIVGIERAEIAPMGLIQKESFQGLEDERIHKHRPILDGNGVIRVKTNIVFRYDTKDFRYPLILPSNHMVVKLLIMAKRQEVFHAG